MKTIIIFLAIAIAIVLSLTACEELVIVGGVTKAEYIPGSAGALLRPDFPNGFLLTLGSSQLLFIDSYQFYKHQIEINKVYEFHLSKDPNAMDRMIVTKVVEVMVTSPATAR